MLTGTFQAHHLFLLNLTVYRKGLNACQAEFAVKKYKSHRRCSPTLMMDVGVLLN